MTHKKLQKLCYYAQCWHFYFCNKERLADTDFQAWVHGPVSRKLYDTYRDYRYEEIPQYDGKIEIADESMEVIKSVYRAYGHLDANQLESLSHSEKPWQNARVGLTDYDPSYEVISEEDMYQYCVDDMNKSQPDV